VKSYSERTDAVIRKMETIKQQRKRRRALITGIGTCCVVAVLLAVLFVPFSHKLPDVSAYRGSPYYQVIKSLNKASHRPSEYKNNFELLMHNLGDMFAGAMKEDMMNGAAGGAAVQENLSSPLSNSYQEVTDNQVAGVIEADLFKRTDKHIFYLQDLTLKAYTIAQEDSAMVGGYALQPWEQTSGWLNGCEMYLSRDGKTITVMMSGYGDLEGKKSSFTCVVSLDVSDPANMKEVGRIYITGSYLSSRMVDGKLLVMSEMYVWNPDFDKEETFLPQIGTPGNMQSIPAENIICPETVNNVRYTVVTALTEKDLSQAGHTAFLGYTDALYVSGNNIFTTREYIKDCTMTEISWVSYGEALEYRGSISVAGWVKDQYSMDEYEGILRVVTSTDDGGAGRNASLYCIDIESKKVVASVEKFAPEGERAESVRFDGTMAYVCTAEVVTLTDPVYFFDLSDLENITVKDTGTIDGYSSSLVNFGDGFLLGIGFGDTRQLKIEIYAENDTGVVSVDTLELEAEFSLDYKSYLIDRENKLIGLGIWSWDSGDTQYLLVGFDGVRLKTLKEEPLEGNVHQMRATIIDGWLYLLAKEFKAVPLM